MAIDTDDYDPVEAEACEKHKAQLRELKEYWPYPGPFTVSCG